MIRRLSCLLVVIAMALAAGCDKKEKEAPAEDKQAAAKATPAEPAKPQVKPAEAIFPKNKVTMPVPAKGLKPGMPAEEAKKAAPKLFEKSWGVKLEEYEGVKMTAQLDKDKTKLFVVQVIFTDITQDAARKMLTTKWGEPRVGGSEEFPRYYWSNTEAGLRAKLENYGKKGSKVVLGDVISLEQFLGKEKDRFGFEKIPLLGASEKDAMAAFPAMKKAKDDPNRLWMNLPALEQSEHGSALSANLKNGKIARWQISVYFKFDKMVKDKLLSSLETRYGKPKKGRMYLDYKGPPRVKVDANREDSLTIWVGKKIK